MKNQQKSRAFACDGVGTGNQCTSPNLSGNGQSGERIFGAALNPARTQGKQMYCKL